jgi:hypothetical protein
MLSAFLRHTFDKRALREIFIVEQHINLATFSGRLLGQSFWVRCLVSSGNEVVNTASSTDSAAADPVFSDATA